MYSAAFANKPAMTLLNHDRPVPSDLEAKDEGAISVLGDRAVN